MVETQAEEDGLEGCPLGLCAWPADLHSDHEFQEYWAGLPYAWLQS